MKGYLESEQYYHISKKSNQNYINLTYVLPV